MFLKGKRILVTGGTGSLGKTLVQRVLSGELGLPKKVMVFSRDEAKQHDMRMAYLNKTATTDEVIFRNFMNVLEFRIGDVRDYAAVCTAVRDVDVVVNAAALKREFSSAGNVLSFAGAVKLLRQHKLMVGTGSTRQAGELLR